jgi:hypothetical protein
MSDQIMVQFNHNNVINATVLFFSNELSKANFDQRY